MATLGHLKETLSENMRSHVSVFGRHGLLLLYLAQHPDTTMRKMALTFGLTERRIARVLKDLIEADMIEVKKRHSRNSYSIVEDAVYLHASLPEVKLGDIVSLVKKEGSRSTDHFTT